MRMSFVEFSKLWTKIDEYKVMQQTGHDEDIFQIIHLIFWVLFCAVNNKETNPEAVKICP